MSNTNFYTVTFTDNCLVNEYDNSLLLRFKTPEKQGSQLMYFPKRLVKGYHKICIPGHFTFRSCDSVKGGNGKMDKSTERSWTGDELAECLAESGCGWRVYGLQHVPEELDPPASVEVDEELLDD